MPLGHDTILDEDGDLDFSSGDGRLVVSLPQRISIVIKTIFGEWFLDEALGIPYFEEIWVKAPDLQRITAIFRSAVLAIEGVDEILAFKVVYNPAERNLLVEMKLSVDQDELDHSEVIEF